MPELRKDPVIGRWVIIASERARRPGNFVDRNDSEIEMEERQCSLCADTQNAIATMPQVFSDSADSSLGDVKVVPANPSSVLESVEFIRSKKGLYDVISGFGAHEVVIETPEHITNMTDLSVPQIRLVFETYAARIQALEKNEQYQFAIVYKNYGVTIRDYAIGHSRSYVVATPVRPLRVKEKLIGAKDYYDQKHACIYCDLIQQELASGDRIVHETEHFIAFVPFAARFLFEIKILPKEHHCDYHLGLRGKEADLAQMMKIILEKIQNGLDDPAYSYVIQTAPFRRTGLYSSKWKTIDRDYHWHIELMPQLTRMAGFEKGTGFYICAIPPEDMAEYLRGVE